MFSFLQRPKHAGEVKATPPATEEMISFDAAGIVRAITYHLLDEHRVNAVSPESSEVAVSELHHRIHLLTISADRWAGMKNVERLQWLLNQSHIVVKAASSGSAKLSVR